MNRLENRINLHRIFHYPQTNPVHKLSSVINQTVLKYKFIKLNFEIEFERNMQQTKQTESENALGIHLPNYGLIYMKRVLYSPEKRRKIRSLIKCVILHENHIKKFINFIC